MHGRRGKAPVNWCKGSLLSSCSQFSQYSWPFGAIIYAGASGCGSFGQGPCPGMVVLTIASHTLNSPTNVTLNVRNSGSVAVTLISYYAENATGQVYANSSWPGPTLSANAVTPINILIDGIAFTFQSGHTYNVGVATSRNGQWGFTIQA